MATAPKKKDDEIDDTPNETEDERIGRVVNAAVSSQLKRGGVKDIINAAVQAALEPAMATLTETITKTLKAAGGGSGDGGDGGGDNKGAKLPPDVQKRIDEIERSNKRLTEENATSKAEAARERLANQQAEERQILRKELAASGVSEERIDGALALLYTERKKVKRDGEGKIRFSTTKDGYPEDVDVSVGVAEWTKSAEGKAYLPADNVSGTGTRSGRPPTRGKGEPSEQELLQELGNQLMGQAPTIKLG